MNKDNAKDYLPLVQALAEGRVIQIEIDGVWVDGKEFQFVDKPWEYRIKPEPREIWVVNGYEELAFFDKCDALEYGGSVVRYREVIE